ncbi:hypothetical protein [Halorarum salinum]|uniref:Peptidase C-terminal archaeal/bacterial domain-containing protein n=1 Tax=Halorarum salinum TaxID=2743089 RepID=A0A7D5LCE1_9EURY|nr:hypothetical protein [Halobaculum salinum]QLG63310.1 hypothetical protein HUG12_16860 [Halobaculum salinum]
MSGDNAVLAGSEGIFFDRRDGEWNRDTNVRPDIVTRDVAFGVAASLSGDTAVIGAPYDTPTFSGSVYVYRRRNGEWTRETKLVPDDVRAGGRFGQSVAVSGNTAVIEARGYAGELGAVYVFSRQGGQWSREAKLGPNDVEEEHVMGRSVAISENTIVIGVYDNVSGDAYVFSRQNGQWERTTTLHPDGKSSYKFGNAVAVNEDTALIGAIEDNGFRGAVYVFNRSGGSWDSETKLRPNDPHPSSWFGQAVSIDGNSALVGAPGDLFTVENGGTAGPKSLPGSAYVFAREDGDWTQSGKLTPMSEQYERFEEFGATVALSEATALIGASQDKDQEFDQALMFNYGGYQGETSELVPESSIECGGMIECHLGDDSGSGQDSTGFPYADHFYDVYSFSGKQHDIVTISMDIDYSGGRTGESRNPYLILLDPSQGVVAADDDSGLRKNALIATELPEDGEYTIVATSTEPGQKFEYSIRLGCENPE